MRAMLLVAVLASALIITGCYDMIYVAGEEIEGIDLRLASGEVVTCKAIELRGESFGSSKNFANLACWIPDGRYMTIPAEHVSRIVLQRANTDSK